MKKVPSTGGRDVRTKKSIFFECSATVCSSSVRRLLTEYPFRTDILAIDQACVDMVYAMTEEEHHALVERIESRHGLRQLSYMKELGMGNDRYIIIDLDNGGRRITVGDAVKDLKPFVAEQ